MQFLPRLRKHRRRFCLGGETLERRLLLATDASFMVLEGVEVPLLLLPRQDNAALQRAAPLEKSSGKFSFATPIDVSISHNSAGTWRNTSDGRLFWQIVIRSEGARSLNLGFDQYQMPDDGELRIYAPDADPAKAVQVYTAADNEVHGQLWTSIIDGDQVVIDVNIPKDQIDGLKLSLRSVNHGFRDYRQSLDLRDKIGNDRTGACNVDVICSAETLPGLGEEIDKYRDQIRAVGAYTLGGKDTCSGALVNNTAIDGRPYFLTAAHCGVTPANAASMVVYWNFECSYCRIPGSAESGGVADGHLDQKNTGAIWRATYASSDFTLVELDDPIDPTYGVYYAGWDNSGANATTAAVIHHPDVAEKRISFEFDGTAITSWGGPLSPGDGTHILVVDWDAGTTEGGSSGAPLFDQNGRIIGQLHGGDAACGNNLPDWFGRFARSWTGGGTPETRLSDWLDPLGIAPVTWDGLNAPTPQGVIKFETAVALGDATTISLRDSDLTAEIIEIPLTTSAGDSEVITLARISAGFYQASVEVIASGITVGNGSLEAAPGDVATATYKDADDGQGGIDVEISAIAEVTQTLLSGSVWNDLNQNGILDAGEQPLEGQLVFADINNDQAHQANEPYAQSNAAGEYTLVTVAGNYPVRTMTAWQQTFPVQSVAEAEPNDTIATAQDLDVEVWSLLPDENIEDATTRPHVSILGTGNQSFDYYRFSVANAGDAGVFDIDGTNLGFNTELFLFSSNGALLVNNDDDYGDPGSEPRNSRIVYTFSASGWYVIGVGRFDSEGSQGGITGNPPRSGDIYTLHVTLDGQVPLVENHSGHVVSVIAGTTTADLDFGLVENGDQTAPSLDAIRRQSPAASPTNADSVTFSLTFSEAVTLVTADDFVLNLSGGVTANGSLTLGDAADADQSTYTLSIDSIDGSGTVGIDLSPTLDITDLAGNPLLAGEPTTDESYLLDNSPPMATISSTATDPSNLVSIPITISFSEVVSGFEMADITLDGSSGSNFASSDNQTFTFDLTPAADGTILVDLAGSIAMDLAGNANLSANQLTLVSDRTVPLLDSITRLTPEANPTNADSLVFRLTFAEVVQLVDAIDFTVTGGSTAAISNVTSSDGQTYVLTISGGDLDSFNGTVGIDLAGDTDIVDLAGNALLLSEPPIDEAYQVDNSSPTVLLSTTASSPTNLATIPLTVTFSEPVVGFELDDLTLSGASGGNLFTADNQTFTLDLTPDGDGPITVDGAAGMAADAAGNSNGPASQLTLVSDRTVPLLDSITRLTPEANPTNADSLFFRLTFAEVVQLVDAIDFTVTGGSTAAISNVTSSDSQTYELTVSGGDLDFFNGTVGIDLAVGTDIVDLAGNALSLAEPPIDEIFLLDNTPDAVVVRCHLFYDNSSFDIVSDDAAIASDKSPLLPGATGSFANYSSYSAGINGVMIDIMNLPLGVALDPESDFAFATGNDDTPDDWTPLNVAPAVEVRRGAGIGGADRVVLTWPAGTIRGTWLEIRLRATAHTGLASDDLFYFGSAPGETGDSPTDAQINGTDFLGVRLNPATFLNPATLENRYDFNRDGLVDALDLGIVRDHSSSLGNLLNLISPTSEFAGKRATLLAAGEPDADKSLPIVEVAGSNEHDRFRGRSQLLRQIAASPPGTKLAEDAVDRVLASYVSRPPTDAPLDGLHDQRDGWSNLSLDELAADLAIAFDGSGLD